MDIEKVALEAIKQKIDEMFKKVQLKSSIEGKEIVFRLSIPNEVTPVQENPLRGTSGQLSTNNLTYLDPEAAAAQQELLQ